MATALTRAFSGQVDPKQQAALHLVLKLAFEFLPQLLFLAAQAGQERQPLVGFLPEVPGHAGFGWQQPVKGPGEMAGRHLLKRSGPRLC